MDKLWRQVISKVYDSVNEALKVTVVSGGGGGGGSATEAKQDVGNASLSSIDTKLTNPLPVSGSFYQVTQPVSGPLTDTQLRASAVPVSGAFYQATQPISGTVTANAGTNLNTSALALESGGHLDSIDTKLSSQATASKQDIGNASLASLDSKLTNPLPVSGPLTDTQLRATAVPVSGTFFQATQPISGSVSVSNFPASQAVTGPLTDTQLRATAVPVSGTFFQTTQPISAVSLPLPTGAATESTLSAQSAKLPATLGQKAMSASLAVAIASDQSSIPVTGTFFQATQPISGTVTANQGTSPWVVSGSVTANAGTNLNTSALALDATLAAQSAKLPATIGQKAMAASLAVVIASDQSGVPVTGTFFQATQPISAASLPLPSGASTGTKQDTGNASLASIDGKITAVNTGAVVVASSALPSGASTSGKQDTMIAGLAAINSLTPSVYDYISLSYTGTDLTGVVFKSGGSGGTTISTLTLAYSASILQSVTRT